MLRLFCLFYATVPFPYSSKYLLFCPKVRVLESYEIPLLGCRFSCRSGVKWSMSWKKVSRRSFFTPFNFYTSIKFLTFRRLLLGEIENSSPVVFFVAHYGANWARICVGETNFWMLAPHCKFLRDSNLISAFCFDAHNHSLETWIFCLFNQANTKWKLSALDSQIGFSFRKAMKVRTKGSTALYPDRETLTERGELRSYWIFKLLITKSTVVLFWRSILKSHNVWNS